MWVHCNKIHHKLTTQSAPHQNHHHPKHKDEGQKYLIHNVNGRKKYHFFRMRFFLVKNQSLLTLGDRI